MSNLPELSFKPRSLPARVCVKKLPRHVLHYIKQCAVPEIIHNPHPPKPPPPPPHTHTHRRECNFLEGWEILQQWNINKLYQAWLKLSEGWRFLQKIPSKGEVWIISGTTQCEYWYIYHEHSKGKARLWLQLKLIFHVNALNVSFGTHSGFSCEHT